MKHVKMRVTPAPAASGSTSSRCRTVASYVSLQAAAGSGSGQMAVKSSPTAIPTEISRNR